MNVQERNSRPDLVLDFVFMYQCLLDFYSQPDNKQYLKVGCEEVLWDKIFLHTFGVDPVDQFDPAWDILFIKYSAMAANDYVRNELKKNKAVDLQTLVTQPLSLQTKLELRALAT